MAKVSSRMSVRTDAGWSAAGAVLVTASVFGMLLLAIGITAWNGDKQIFGTLVETIENLAMVAGGFWLRSLVPPRDPPPIEIAPPQADQDRVSKAAGDGEG